MPLQTIALLVLAAIGHSVWNLLSKRSLDKQVFLWLALVAATGIFCVPFGVLYAPIPLIGLGIALISGLVEAGYFLLLGSAYQRGDLSLVYPLARGSAPLVVTLFALIFLHERPSAEGIAGILLIVAGIYALHLRSLDRSGLLAPFASLRRDRASQLALLVGVVIAVYSVIDKVGVSYVNPLLYIYLIFVVSCAALAPYMLLARRAAIVREWRKNWVTILAAAMMFVGSYLLVLIALTTTQVAYVSSVRELSVVFGALLGTLVLREAFGATKVFGAFLIFAGIVAIGIAA
jgi:drug/metabolite transporter (DMT)-like permease